jgi:hypothetical protein
MLIRSAALRGGRWCALHGLGGATGGRGRRAAGGDGEAGEANGPLAREVWALSWPMLLGAGSRESARMLSRLK